VFLYREAHTHTHAPHRIDAGPVGKQRLLGSCEFSQRMSAIYARMVPRTSAWRQSMSDGAAAIIASRDSSRNAQPFHRRPPAVSNVIFRRSEPNGRRLAWFVARTEAVHMSIVTISRGLFSSGQALAERVAEMLGYRSMSRELLLEATRRYEIPEAKLTEQMETSPETTRSTRDSTPLSHCNAGYHVRGGAIRKNRLPRPRGQELLLASSTCSKCDCWLH
jgi:hypothetical protein